MCAGLARTMTASLDLAFRMGYCDFSKYAWQDVQVPVAENRRGPSFPFQARAGSRKESQRREFMKDMLGKSGFDVIGDVHGHAAELTILFKRMGYQETNGVLRHPEGRRVGLCRPEGNVRYGRC